LYLFATNPRSAPSGSETVPAWAQALRDAARFPPLEWGDRFGAIADRCVFNLKQQLGERYSPELSMIDHLRLTRK
jgi:hypothetical protein